MYDVIFCADHSELLKICLRCLVFDFWTFENKQHMRRGLWRCTLQIYFFNDSLQRFFKYIKFTIYLHCTREGFLYCLTPSITSVMINIFFGTSRLQREMFLINLSRWFSQYLPVNFIFGAIEFKVFILGRAIEKSPRTFYFVRFNYEIL